MFPVVLTVRVELVPGEIDVGFKEHVGAGLPPPVTAHARVTVGLPVLAVTLIVDMVDPPAEMLAEVGFAVRAKLLPPFTVRLT